MVKSLIALSAFFLTLLLINKCSSQIIEKKYLKLLDEEGIDLSTPITLEKFEEAMRTSFYSDVCIFTYKFLEIFEKKFSRNQIIAHDQQQVSQFLNSDLVKILQKDLERAKKHSKVEELEGWTIYLDEPDKQAYYQQEAGMKLNSFLEKMKVEANFLDIIAMFEEADLFPTWLKGISMSEKLYEPCHNRKLIHMIGDKFLILRRRESFTEFSFIPSQKLKSDGSSELDEENAFLMRFDSVDTSDWLGNKVEKQKDTISLKFKNGFLLLKPLDEKLSEIIFVSTVDLDFYDFIPVSLINYGFSKLVPLVIESILSRAKSLPPIYQERIASKPELYEPLRELGEIYMLRNRKDGYQDDYLSKEAFVNQQELKKRKEDF